MERTRRSDATGQERARVAVVLAGGDGAHPDLVLPRAGLVVAADSGADQAAPLGLDVDVVVGDLDSIAPQTLADLRHAGVAVEGHHPDKDATDVDLALARAVAGDPERIVLVGGHGGRLDHALATLAALAGVAAPGRRVEAWMGPAQVVVTVDEAAVEARPGEIVSLLPVGGPAEGVTTTGLRWPLVDATLPPWSTWGMSNEVVGDPPGVTVRRGVLAVVRPHALTPELDAPDAVPTRPANPEEPSP
jgi:thiamine pyrophosphokinase